MKYKADTTNVKSEVEKFKDKSPEDTIKELQVDVKKGLSSAEVSKRLQRDGYNDLPENKESWFKRIAKRFYGPIPFMIELAAALSGLVQKWEDMGIILFLLFFNAVIDILQESRAMNALEVLKGQLARKCIVLRNGEYKTIDAKNIVAGDIIKLKIGVVVPADIKIIEADEIQIDQSALTGESLPVNKKTGDIAYGNSVVKKGEATAVVVGTGARTYFGKTVALVAKAEKEKKSHLQEAVIKLGKYLIVLTVSLAAIVFFVSLYRGESFVEILRYVLVLTIASIPVALPAILSATMAVGAIRLSKKKAIVSKLSAIEEFAGMDTLCFDKTGTLTQNKMSVSEPVTFGKYKENELMLYAALSSNEEEQDPIEVPIFEYLKKNGIYSSIKNYKRLKFVPFNPVDKRTEVIVKKGRDKLIVVKGATQVILDMSKTPWKKKIEDKVQEFSEEGMRTLGVGIKKEGSRNFEFVGLIPMLDPPREDSAEIIKESRGLGLNLKMITGDNLAIASYIAKLVGIGNNILNVHLLKTETKSGKVKNQGNDMISGKVQSAKTVKNIEKADGFAQVYPEDKYFIVDNLQKAGHIVGMTGDGVNDSPPLKKADGGIAVSGATDAARAAADIILLNPGLEVIIDAIKESRRIFERMKSYSTYRIAETIRIIMFITASIVFLDFYPISPLMVILLLIFNDLPILTIAYDNTKVNDKPVRWDVKQVLTISTVLGITGVIASFGILYLSKVYFVLPMAFVQTIVFLKLAVAGHSTIYVTRTEKRFWQRPFPAPLLLIAGIGTEIIATLFAAFGWFITPIGWEVAGLIWAYSLVWLFVNDQIKISLLHFLERRKDRSKNRMQGNVSEKGDNPGTPSVPSVSVKIEDSKALRSSKIMNSKRIKTHVPSRKNIKKVH